MELHKANSRDDLVCISLSLDYLGEADSPPESFKPDVLKFLKSQNAEFDNVLATEDYDTMLQKMDAEDLAPPIAFVYNRKGEMVKRFDNSEAATEEDAFTYEDVEKVVAPLMEEE